VVVGGFARQLRWEAGPCGGAAELAAFRKRACKTPLKHRYREIDGYAWLDTHYVLS
jgi:hypothetical protein